MILLAGAFWLTVLIALYLILAPSHSVCYRNLPTFGACSALTLSRSSDHVPQVVRPPPAQALYLALLQLLRAEQDEVANTNAESVRGHDNYQPTHRLFC